MSIERRESRGTWFRSGGEIGRERRLDLDRMLLPHERDALGKWHWEMWSRDPQLPPTGDWRVWLISAGRGFGKTRAGPSGYATSRGTTARRGSRWSVPALVKRAA